MARAAAAAPAAAAAARRRRRRRKAAPASSRLLLNKSQGRFCQQLPQLQPVQCMYCYNASWNRDSQRVHLIKVHIAANLLHSCGQGCKILSWPVRPPVSPFPFGVYYPRTAAFLLEDCDTFCAFGERVYREQVAASTM